MPSQKETAETAFLTAWKEGPLGSTALVREHRFHQERKWRFDFSIPDMRLAIEIEGRGRHQTIAGFRGDCEKYNTALEYG